MKIRGARTQSPRIEILPLIDVVFLLLVVFIYAMLSMAVHKGMPVDLPLAQQIQPTKDRPLPVPIEADGIVFLNKAPLPLDELADTLRQYPDSGAESDVLLFADHRLPYQRLSGAGPQRREERTPLALRTRPPGQPPHRSLGAGAGALRAGIGDGLFHVVLAAQRSPVARPRVADRQDWLEAPKPGAHPVAGIDQVIHSRHHGVAVDGKHLNTVGFQT
jgi:biopolymer transport protein ExbD